MLGSPILAKASRNWKLIVMTGAAGFAVGLMVYFFSGPDWIIAALTQPPAPVAGIVMARRSASAPRHWPASSCPVAGAAKRDCCAPRSTT